MFAHRPTPRTHNFPNSLAPPKAHNHFPSWLYRRSLGWSVGLSVRRSVHTIRRRGYNAVRFLRSLATKRPRSYSMLPSQPTTTSQSTPKEHETLHIYGSLYHRNHPPCRALPTLPNIVLPPLSGVVLWVVGWEGKSLEITLASSVAV